MSRTTDRLAVVMTDLLHGSSAQDASTQCSGAVTASWVFVVLGLFWWAARTPLADLGDVFREG
jgi:hypothetical protein